ncbi:conjugal transfer protein [Orientia tsutsugamushi]|uniref:conjugal transfer protein n=1 Tax=Orientia tsutsugamushi TaxID=784 RepID=UPI003529C101
MKFLLLLLGCISLTSFFFESNFDCKIPKGQKCKSLYEIKTMVAQGVFDINNLEKVETSKIKSKRRCIICYRRRVDKNSKLPILLNKFHGNFLMKPSFYDQALLLELTTTFLLL